MDEIKAQFETIFFGVIRVTQQVLPTNSNYQNLATAEDFFLN
jgi:hypothetical protein